MARHHCLLGLSIFAMHSILTTNSFDSSVQVSRTASTDCRAVAFKDGDVSDVIDSSTSSMLPARDSDADDMGGKKRLQRCLDPVENPALDREEAAFAMLGRLWAEGTLSTFISESAPTAFWEDPNAPSPTTSKQREGRSKS